MSSRVRMIELWMEGGEKLESSYRALATIFNEGRRIDGSEDVQVLIDEADPTHLVALVRWESDEARARYDDYRNTLEGQMNLPRYRALKVRPAIVSEWRVDDSI